VRKTVLFSNIPVLQDSDIHLAKKHCLHGSMERKKINDEIRTIRRIRTWTLN